MLIKKVVLNNIRSYVSESISFPEGSVLLAGEIGSGKSSILLAIEFALFGITRGVLSGSSLLRVGEEQGFVELHLTVDKKDVVIKRTLKRVKNDVRQHSGYIIIGGVKQEATPVELKSMVLGLLGYPAELLTKSKSLIYRYTVYCPQEEMKRILMEQSEYRVDTLRKIFQMEKYKRIRENGLLVVRELKQLKARYKGQIEELVDREETLKRIKLEAEKKQQDLLLFQVQVDEAKEQLSKANKKVGELEKEMKSYQELKSRVEVADAKLIQLVQSNQSNAKELSRFEQEMAVLDKKISEIDVDKLIEVREIQARLEKLQEKRDELLRLVAEFEHDIKSLEKQNMESKETVDKIAKLSKCPLCLQDVSPEHIRHIREEFAKKGELDSGQKTKIAAKLGDMKKELGELTSKQLALREQVDRAQKQNITFKEKESMQKLLAEKKRGFESLEMKIKQDKQEVGRLNIMKRQLGDELKHFGDLESKIVQVKGEHQRLLMKERDVAIQNTRLKSECDSLERELHNLRLDIKRMLEIKKRIQVLSEKLHWLEELFINLMVSMEKQVMMRLHNEFNEIFQEFFQVLMESESMAIRLDAHFTPIIEQDGYELEFEDLSGGEKTSLALSYRLALNKVINELIQSIKTKELIILDEPTDGFSSSQLDNVKQVLEQINIEQIIIVSHESKIESFVDNVLRVIKRDGVSSVG